MSDSTPDHVGAYAMTVDEWREARGRTLRGLQRYMVSIPETTTLFSPRRMAGVPSAWDNAPRDWLSITGTLTDWFEDCYVSAAMGRFSPVVREIERTSSGELRITWTTLRPSELSENGEPQDDA